MSALTLINNYLKEITQDDFTAKDFRCWAGSVNALLAFQQSEIPQTQTESTTSSSDIPDKQLEFKTNEFKNPNDSYVEKLNSREDQGDYIEENINVDEKDSTTAGVFNSFSSITLVSPSKYFSNNIFILSNL